VLHLSPHARSALPEILNRAGRLPAAQAADGERIRGGRIYVAPPDRHLLMQGDRARVTRGPRENGQRPAVDALFRSAAAAYGDRVIGVVLSGVLDDGTAGLYAIEEAGGTTIVQGDAEYQDMPRSAAAAVAVDHVAPLAEIGPLVTQLVSNAGGAIEADVRPRPSPATDDADAEAQAAEQRVVPTEFVCPDCGGVLWQPTEGPLRFRCRVGHAFSPEALLARQADSLEGALWTALRTLEERAKFLRRLADRMGQREKVHLAARFNAHAKETDERAELIRQALLTSDLVTHEGPLETNENGGAAEEAAPGP
jgi:two-component system chemotaxis response regulator CheB